MPFYEYQCAACGHHHEELQKVTDRPLRKCPACGRPSLKRLVSAPVFRLKGGGWYETDFKGDKENRRNLAGDKEPAEKPAEKATEKPADAKSDASAKKTEPAGASGGTRTETSKTPAARPPPARRAGRPASKKLASKRRRR